MKLGMQHWGLKLYKSGINDDIRLTLTYLTAWSNWTPVNLNGKSVTK